MGNLQVVGVPHGVCCPCPSRGYRWWVWATLSAVRLCARASWREQQQHQVCNSAHLSPSAVNCEWSRFSAIPVTRRGRGCHRRLGDHSGRVPFCHKLTVPQPEAAVQPQKKKLDQENLGIHPAPANPLNGPHWGGSVDESGKEQKQSLRSPCSQSQSC